ncbi:MAG: sulfite exporter TauE/SafE family protein [Paludibacteraceae bacterium]|nr:sulfite exporter TauE/SafE family protein [Paludibacteraceae bacterium]
MDFLQNLLDNSQVPAFTAFLLGLLTALSPCPLATNITAIAFISKGIENRKRVFWSGILYTIGRTLAYSILGAVLIYIIRKGADTFDLQQSISEWGELIIGPALLSIGILMIISEFVDLGGRFGFNGGSWAEKLSGPIGAFIIGVMFALAFCPSSGLLYFGMLIPMSATANGGYLLPVIYAVATALPVLIVAWLLAFSVKSISSFLGKISVIQKWFNRIVALAFIVVGLNYCHTFFIA